MTKEQLFKIARYYFKTGTKFISCFGTKDSVKDDSSIFVEDFDKITLNGNIQGGRVIYDGKWAKVWQNGEYKDIDPNILDEPNYEIY